MGINNTIDNTITIMLRKLLIVTSKFIIITEAAINNTDVIINKMDVAKSVLLHLISKLSYI